MDLSILSATLNFFSVFTSVSYLYISSSEKVEVVSAVLVAAEREVAELVNAVVNALAFCASRRERMADVVFMFLAFVEVSKL